MLITFCFEFNGHEVDWEYDVDWSYEDLIGYISSSFDNVKECYDYIFEHKLIGEDLIEEFKKDFEKENFVLDDRKYNSKELQRFVDFLDSYGYVDSYDFMEYLDEDDDFNSFEDYLKEEYYEEAKDDYFENENDGYW